ncbi:hypothetical protein BJ878DRAFT_520709 [Calycina marina]|uniref:Uncharacterized protein n=1 Tax=Calycina marina TaxID=1763456 RepID=A0A9P7YWS4_9HELO|nr:hypothetical protein BJ878DRAFT_520709 [Calycina marina]
MSLSSAKFTRFAPRNVCKLASTSKGARPLACTTGTTPAASRSLATANPGSKALPDIWFTGSAPRPSISNPYPQDPVKPPDERTVKLGKTLRVLQERLPNLLQSPLPQEIISPQITLHLFPSTHPHLPTVSGRVAYSAALWTSPIAWGRMPLVGNVKLKIISERMVNPDTEYHSAQPTTRPEQLIVRWSTVGKLKDRGIGGFYKGISASGNVDKITEWLGGGKGEKAGQEFTGLFIFEFDEEGRVVTHTIEHVQHGGNWEKGVGAKVVGLTDWLLGGMKPRGEEGSPCPAFSTKDERDDFGKGMSR